ncbi:uncharacterized protein LOC141901339 [Tubulanus polymorphus]|uniref:uncharacterized protein LOC141901339 n=1 Tax=Tubulanus polymorphus TaxID=672921 RepID=UPI003DA3A004
MPASMTSITKALSRYGIGNVTFTRTVDPLPQKQHCQQDAEHHEHGKIQHPAFTRLATNLSSSVEDLRHQQQPPPVNRYRTAAKLRKNVFSKSTECITNAFTPTHQETDPSDAKRKTTRSSSTAKMTDAGNKSENGSKKGSLRLSTFIPRFSSSGGNTLPSKPKIKTVTTNSFDAKIGTNADEVKGGSRSSAGCDGRLRTAVSHDTLSNVDISGPINEQRFPWQHDMAVQCDISIQNGPNMSAAMNDVAAGACSPVAPPRKKPPSGRTPTRGSEPTITVIPPARRRRKTPTIERPKSLNVPNNLSNEYFSKINGQLTPGGKIRSQSCVVGPYSNETPQRSTGCPGSYSDDSDDDTFDHSFYTHRNTKETQSLDRHNQKRRVPDNGWKLHPDAARVRRRLQHHHSDPTAEFLRVTDEFDGDEVLISPSISPAPSPLPWRKLPELIITDIENNLHRKNSTLTASEENLLRVPKQQFRRASIGSIHSTSDESDDEPSPPMPRRGRRAAIYESKNFGDVSPSSYSPDVSPGNSCDEGEDNGNGNQSARLQRRRSSVDLGMQVYPGDLLMHDHHKKMLIKRNTIADFYANKPCHGSTASLTSDKADDSVNRKNRNSFSLLKLIDKRTRSKECLHELSESIGKLKPSEFKDNHIASYKNVHWSDLIASRDKQGYVEPAPMIPETERKRREAVWELFKSECVFLIDHLMVLKHCFMEPLKQLQVDGHLMFAEPQDIFGNLDELCYVSYTFCRDFISLLLRDMSPSHFGSTAVLIKAFKKLSQHSKNAEVYHSYCLNYTNALTYLEQLRKNDDFLEFERHCELDLRCKRLQLNDLLVAPMQHCTKMPLMISNIRKYTIDAEERQQLTESIEKMETSLKSLEEKMKWLKNFERVQEIQQQLVWQPISEMDPRVYIPDFLKHTLSRQPCERLLASPKRQLLYEGQLYMMDNSKPVDVCVFLFDDILLITKIKKPTRKKSNMTTNTSDTQSSNNSRVGSDNALIVYRQPIALDRFTIHDVGPHEAAVNGLRHAFVLVQISRFQQIIGVYTLQATSESIKVNWLAHLRDSKEKYKETVQKQQQQQATNGQDPKTKRKSPRLLLKHLSLHPQLQSTDQPPPLSPTSSPGQTPETPKAPEENGPSILTGRSSSLGNDGMRDIDEDVEPVIPLASDVIGNHPRLNQIEPSTTSSPLVSPADLASSNHIVSSSPETEDASPSVADDDDDDDGDDVVPSVIEFVESHSSSVSSDPPPPSPQSSARTNFESQMKRASRLQTLRQCHEKSKSVDTVYL